MPLATLDKSIVSWATQGVLQNLDPKNWKFHRFGLPPARWESLKGKSFWITGAGTGYGRALAMSLASAEAQIFLTGRRLSMLENSLEEIRSFDIPVKNCHIIPADLNDPEQILQACLQVKRNSRSLYGLINNAAIACERLPDPFQRYSLEKWDEMFRVNLTAPWLLTREIFPHMAKGNALRVLFMTSEAGWASTSGFGPYNTSKAALNNLTASLAQEYSNSYPKLDLQMNALVPGEARTEMNPYSEQSPYSVVSMALILLSHPTGGPNGKFFHRDGRHLEFAYATPYAKHLLG